MQDSPSRSVRSGGEAVAPEIMTPGGRVLLYKPAEIGEVSMMRLVILFFFCSAGLLLAQNVDQRMAQILKPASDTTSYLSGKTFYGGRQYLTGSAYTKPFLGTGAYGTGQFRTQAYRAGAYWSGKTYQTGSAAFAGLQHRVTTAGEQIAGKTVPTGSAVDAGRKAAAGSYAGVRPYLVTGKAQEALAQQQSQGGAMTIDQLRDVLNKTR